MERTKLGILFPPASRALRRVAARVSCPSWAARAPSVLTYHCALISRYESVITTLCENLDSLDEPEARAAMIWIVGEYKLLEKKFLQFLISLKTFSLWN